MNVPEPATGPLVVVVEDDPASRKSLGRLLHIGGYTAEMFGSAAAYLSGRPDRAPLVMLLDLQLPCMSGMDLLRQIRAEGTTLPVVILTSFDDPQAREEARRLGCVAFLTKPCGGATILALLRTLAQEGA